MEYLEFVCHSPSEFSNQEVAFSQQYLFVQKKATFGLIPTPAEETVGWH